MKNIRMLTLISFFAMLILFNNCGGSSSCDVTTEVVAVDTVCNDDRDAIASYIPLYSGDIVTRDEENTVIKIYHNQDNERVACVVSGQASIIRAL